MSESEGPLHNPGEYHSLKPCNLDVLDIIDYDGRRQAVSRTGSPNWTWPQDDARHSRLSLSPSTAGSDSLVTALSSFPSTPGGPTFGTLLHSPIVSEGNHTPSSSDGSVAGSEDTLIAGCPSLSTLRAPSSTSSAGTSFECHSNDGERIDNGPAGMHSPAPLFLGQPRPQISVAPRLPESDEFGDVADEKIAGDADAFEALLSCLDLRKQQIPSVAEVNARKASPQQLRAIALEFGTNLSS